MRGSQPDFAEEALAAPAFDGSCSPKKGGRAVVAALIDAEVGAQGHQTRGCTRRHPARADAWVEGTSYRDGASKRPPLVCGLRVD